MNADRQERAASYTGEPGQGPRRERLLAAWQDLLPGHEALGAALLDRYAEPHRRYHTLEHLADVLAQIDRRAGGAEDLTAVRLAGWFHDAVYAVGGQADQPSNEEVSARLAESELSAAGVDERVVAEVARLVRLTADHRVGPDDPNGALLCAADLAILSAEPSRYDRYAEQIRAEYEPVYGREAFREGRCAFLRTTLDDPDLDPRARDNLTRELARLGCPSPDHLRPDHLRPDHPRY